MDNNVVTAKAVKLKSVAPVKQPQPLAVQPVTPAPQTQEVPRGVAAEIEPAQGAPGVQPTLAERSNAEDVASSMTDPWETSPMFYEIANYLNIEPKFYSAAKDKVSLVTDWAVQEAGSNKIEDIYHILGQLREGLVSADAFEKPLETMYRYIRLRVHADAANKAVRAFEKVKETY